MKGYEYIRVQLDMGDLAELNSLGSAGWRVVSTVSQSRGFNTIPTIYALLERETPQVK